MSAAPRLEEISALLRQGTEAPERASKLMPLLYDELRHLAKAQVQRMAKGRSMQGTELVHEAWMRVVRGGDPGWQGRAHFFGAAANAMRNILVEQARRRSALKRDAAKREAIDDDLPDLTAGPSNTDVLALHEALLELERSHERAARVVTLRFFSGLEMKDIAGVLDVSVPTVERDWRFARAWLQDRLDGDELPDA